LPKAVVRERQLGVRDLPDAGGPGFVALNAGSEEQIGQQAATGGRSPSSIDGCKAVVQVPVNSRFVNIGTQKMPHLPHSIELHDSRLAAIVVESGTATVRLRPTYVHRDGKGWSQDADLVIRGATLDGGPIHAATIADGKLESGHGPYHNLLDLPPSTPGPVTLELEFFSGEITSIRGTSAEVILVSVPVFVEEVS